MLDWNSWPLTAADAPRLRSAVRRGRLDPSRRLSTSEKMSYRTLRPCEFAGKLDQGEHRVIGKDVTRLGEVARAWLDAAPVLRISLAETRFARQNAGVNIETTRLILRRPTLADVPVLFQFLGDAEAMRHTHTDASLRACRRRVAVHEWCRRRDGYAPWTVVTKADARIIGWGGLYNDPFEPGWGVEVGYFFHPAAWGQGYATELVAACIGVADNILQLPEVSAFARAENIGSRRARRRRVLK